MLTDWLLEERNWVDQLGSIVGRILKAQVGNLDLLKFPLATEYFGTGSPVYELYLDERGCRFRDLLAGFDPQCVFSGLLSPLKFVQ